MSFIHALESGNFRAAFQDTDGIWHINPSVKEGILALFKEGKNVLYPGGYIDKSTLPPRIFTLEDHIRFIPCGSTVRRGAYIAPGVIILPPSYINIGAYIGTSTVVDSHVLVGSCAQIGQRVHLGAGVIIGGVLEPIGQLPVIIEDDAFIGASSTLVDGIHVKSRAVLAPGVHLSPAVSLYDMVNERILPKGSCVPEGAVVVMGTRPASTAWAKHQGLHIQTPLIIKYRDSKTDAAVALESALR